MGGGRVNNRHCHHCSFSVVAESSKATNRHESEHVEIEDLAGFHYLLEALREGNSGDDWELQGT